eukprot:gnl/MRDRNA2_/MRDRNA2_73498_c1_seq1.p1 gnl/MRDRNA2_/MRDRNA2_73498_c1~~gnl/MRDRNA2_/MRDRNA2_73498_c1_seq1.p1  ORF type:complete len:582 (+),score=133.96 gnl/MRDRNA2_/MRDRNA2_73498_c1_seq1:100-1845(+)
MVSATSSFVIIALMALGSILPKQRQILHDITGLSPIILGLLPVSFLLVTFLCNEDSGLGKQSEFSISEATLDVPLGGQFLAIAALLGIFAAAVGEEKQDEKTVQLVRADRIAKRLTCAAGAFGLLHLAVENASSFRPSGFTDSVSIIETPSSSTLSTSIKESEGPSTSTLVIVALLTIGNLVPPARATVQEITGLSSMTMGFLPLIMLGSAALCPAKVENSSFHMADVSVDLSHGMTLLVIAALLGVFATLVGQTEDDSEKKERSKVQLVRADRIAMRLACAAAALGLWQTVFEVSGQIEPTMWSGLPKAASHTSNSFFTSQNFASPEAALEVPESLQIFVISALFFVFKMAISEDLEKTQGKVKLVRADSIAFRFSLVAGLWGLVKLMLELDALAHAASFFLYLQKMLPSSPTEGFGHSEVEVTLGVSEGTQLLILSALLFAFKVAVNDADAAKDDSNEKTKQVNVQLVRADAIAFRLSLAAALWGIAKMMPDILLAFGRCNEMLKKSSATEFGKSESAIEVSEGLQLLSLSALVFVWKMVVSDSEKAEEPLDGKKDLKEPEKEQIQLVCASRSPPALLL